MKSRQPRATSSKKERKVSERSQQSRRRKVRKVQSLNLESEVKPKDDAVAVNTSGLAILPDELLLEIMGYYPEIPFPKYPWQANSNDYTARRERLLALSATCRNLRRFFRPYIWQRIEVCAGMVVEGHRLREGPDSDKMKFNLELVRQLEIVTIRDPSLAEYVTVINAEVKDHSIGPVLAELARSMSLFPNLHTVKLKVARHFYGDTPAREAFSKYSYPQIRSLMLSHYALPLLGSCPQAQHTSNI